MTAFAAASAALFADPNLSVAVLWGPGGTTPSVPLRGIRSRPDQVASFGASRAVVPALVLDLPAAGADGICRGDRITAMEADWTVLSDPVRDREGLTLRVEMART